MFRKYYLILVSIIILTGCSTIQENVMPFRNHSCSGERLFPLKENESEKAFRVWFNNGTSIDRVITISYDSIWGYQGFLNEIGTVSKKGLVKSKTIDFFSQKEIEPQNGYDNFFMKLDSLNLYNYENQQEFEYSMNHRPYSIYSIEIKDKNRYHQFNFKTRFPDTMKVEDKYLIIEKIVFDLFKYKFYRDK